MDFLLLREVLDFPSFFLTSKKALQGLLLMFPDYPGRKKQFAGVHPFTTSFTMEKILRITPFPPGVFLPPISHYKVLKNKDEKSLGMFPVFRQGKPSEKHNFLGLEAAVAGRQVVSEEIV